MTHGVNYTAMDRERLQELNNDIATELVPAIVFIAVLMIVGLAGNLLVCFVFVFRFPKPLSQHTQHFLIVALAVFDLLSCFLAMPAEMADMRYFYNFEDDLACRLLRFINHYCAFASILTLVVIAVDRYRRVCHPLAPQMKPLHTKLSLLAVLLVALAFSVPTPVLYGLRTMETSEPGLYGHDCSTNDAVKDTLLPTLYNGVLFLSFLIILIALTVIYVKIWRELRRHNRYMARNSISRKDSLYHTTSVSEVSAVTSSEFIRQESETSSPTRRCSGSGDHQHNIESGNDQHSVGSGNDQHNFGSNSHQHHQTGAGTHSRRNTNRSSHEEHHTTVSEANNIDAATSHANNIDAAISHSNNTDAKTSHANNIDAAISHSNNTDAKTSHANNIDAATSHVNNIDAATSNQREISTNSTNKNSHRDRCCCCSCDNNNSNNDNAALVMWRNANIETANPCIKVQYEVHSAQERNTNVQCQNRSNVANRDCSLSLNENFAENDSTEDMCSKAAVITAIVDEGIHDCDDVDDTCKFNTSGTDTSRLSVDRDNDVVHPHDVSPHEVSPHDVSPRDVSTRDVSPHDIVPSNDSAPPHDDAIPVPNSHDKNVHCTSDSSRVVCDCPCHTHIVICDDQENKISTGSLHKTASHKLSKDSVRYVRFSDETEQERGETCHIGAEKHFSQLANPGFSHSDIEKETCHTGVDKQFPAHSQFVNPAFCHSERDETRLDSDDSSGPHRKEHLMSVSVDSELQGKEHVKSVFDDFQECPFQTKGEDLVSSENNRPIGAYNYVCYERDSEPKSVENHAGNRDSWIKDKEHSRDSVKDTADRRGRDSLETSSAAPRDSSETSSAVERDSSETSSAVEHDSSETSSAVERDSSETSSAVEHDSSETSSAVERDSSETSAVVHDSLTVMAEQSENRLQVLPVVKTTRTSNTARTQNRTITHQDEEEDEDDSVFVDHDDDTAPGSVHGFKKPRLTKKTSSRSHQEAVNTRKTTVIAMSVTVVFFLSFLPYLSLMTARVVHKDFDERLRGAPLVLYNMFLRSYFINSAANPVIYGVLNAEFRAKCIRLMRQVCSCGKWQA